MVKEKNMLEVVEDMTHTEILAYFNEVCAMRDNLQKFSSGGIGQVTPERHLEMLITLDNVASWLSGFIIETYDILMEEK